MLKILKKILKNRNYLNIHSNHLLSIFSKSIFNFFFFVIDQIFFVIIFLITFPLFFRRKNKNKIILLMAAFDNKKQTIESMYYDTIVDPFIKNYSDKKIVIFNYDIYSYLIPSSRILITSAFINPSILFFDSLPNIFNNLSFYQLWLYRFFFKIKMICLVSDTCNKSYLKLNFKKINLFNKICVLDNPNFDKNWEFLNKYRKIINKIQNVPYLFDFKKFKKKYQLSFLEKSINCCFIGQINSYRDARKPYLDYLLEKNIPVYLSTNDRENFDQLDYKKYYQVLSRSKIGINFSNSANDIHQLKARVWQLIHCEVMLLESFNNQTAFYFEPNLDFVYFHDPQDLIKKINYYLENDDKRLKIVKNAKEKLIKISNYQNSDKYLKL